MMKFSEKSWLQMLIKYLAAVQLLLGLSAANAQDPAAGKEIYYLNGCYTCHGYQGKGTFVLRANILTPKPPVLLKGKAPFLANADLFRTFLRLRGEQRTDKPSVGMPHYPATTIDDAKAADLYAYIVTFAEDEPALEDIETMQWILDWEESR